MESTQTLNVTRYGILSRFYLFKEFLSSFYSFYLFLLTHSKAHPLYLSFVRGISHVISTILVIRNLKVVLETVEICVIEMPEIRIKQERTLHVITPLVVKKLSICLNSSDRPNFIFSGL